MSSAARYYPRAPRYVFRPEDASLLRFAGLKRRAERTHARIQDLSATGLLIVVPTENDSPWVGDMLKIEFQIPGRKQIAWFATVARIDDKQEWDPELGTTQTTLVGLKFHELPAPFLKAIRESLRHRQPKAETPPLEYSHSTPSQFAIPLTRRNQVILSTLSIFMLMLFALMSVPPKYWLR